MANLTIKWNISTIEVAGFPTPPSLADDPTGGLHVAYQASIHLRSVARNTPARREGGAAALTRSQRRIVDVPFLPSAVKRLRIRHVQRRADLQPLRQVRIRQERLAE